jgi:two-component system response regulator NreC
MHILPRLEPTPPLGLFGSTTPFCVPLSPTVYTNRRSESVIPVIEAGASGFVTKAAAFSELASAIQAAYRGDSFLSPSAAAALVEEYQQKADRRHRRDPYDRLTDRERGVLKLIVEGYTAREIGDRLVISPKTVESYKTSLMNKLNIHNKTDLIKYALRKRLITL